MELTGRLYRIFHCWRCSTPIVLPFDTLVPLQSTQEPHTKEIRHAVGVCPSCKLAGIYSEDKESPYYDPRVDVVSGIQNKALDREGWLECEAGDQCPTPVAIYVAASFPHTLEQWREEIATWTWEELHCPSGHRLRRPNKKL